MVYALVAACSSAGGGSAALEDAGPMAATGSGGSGGSGGTGGTGGSMATGGTGGDPSSAGASPVDSGVADVIEDVVDPVPDAMAQGTGGGSTTVCDCPEPEPPEPPIVLTRPCDNVYNEGAGYYYALLEMPGSSLEELAAVRVVEMLNDSTGRFLPDGFDHAATNANLGDEELMVVCTSDENDVVFIIPS